MLMLAFWFVFVIIGSSLNAVRIKIKNRLFYKPHRGLRLYLLLPTQTL